ncbi:MAG: rRNA maturation RNase YbeY [Proteobacteria bacterium]|nr:rRNA maturation RNase YbeY [Pseudomonadota bacterium]
MSLSSLASPPYSLEILIRGKPWPQKKLLTTHFHKTLTQTLNCALKSKHLPPLFKTLEKYPLQINLLLAHDFFVKSLNKKWRHKDSSTNVLSFPSFEKSMSPSSLGSEIFKNPILLGEIVLNYEKCLEEINLQKSFLNHVQHLFLHGILHLLGFDHEHPQEANVMESLEIKILKELSIPNPYQNT